MPETLKLLQVEDSDSDGALIVRHLEQAGYSVSSIRVEDEAGMREALTPGPWDLIICDYRMPRFDAPSALAVLRESGLDIPFLVVSGTIGEDQAVSMMKAGAHDYLMKGNLTRLSAAAHRELREAKSRAERRHAVQTLREREAQLSTAIQATELGIFDSNPETGRAFLSELARKHLRLPPDREPSLGEFVYEIVHPDDRNRVKNALDKVFLPDSDGNFSEEYRLVETLDGDERWISAWGRVSRDEAGKPVRFLGVVRDVTERKRAELDLQFQLQLTACITEQSADCIVLTGLDGQTRFVNPAAERVFGYTFAEFRATTIHDLLHHHYPDGRPFPASECPLAHDLPSNNPMLEREEVFFHKDGTPIDVALSCVPLTLNGASAGIVFTARDIRERKRAERALRESDARFRRLFDAGIVGIMILDGEFIVEANDHFLGLIDCRREDFSGYGLPWNVIAPHGQPEQREHFEKALRSVAANGACLPFENNLIRKDGTSVPVLFAALELNPGVDSRVLGFVVDLTERKSLENQMRQAQKLESIGLLAGGVAHDFNNLLTVIMGYTDMVSDGIGPEDDLRRPIDQISAAAVRAAGLTRQLLTFSRRNAGEPKTIALNELVQGVEGMLRRLIGENIEIVMTADPGDHFIHADPGLIEQVIMNLAVNARDAMPDGGKLYVETSTVTVTESSISPPLDVVPGVYVTLAVTDSGTGMTQEVQARMFEPFFTTKEPGKGTGLGLSTAYGIVRQSGGSITVHSTPGVGTTFRVFIPATASVPAPETSAGADAPVDGTETILLVEDEAGVRNYIRDELSGHGYRPLDTATGADALLIAEQYKGRIDLVLTDMVLPGMNGTVLIERLLRIRPDVKILRMSGYPDRFGVQKESSIPHLQKPFTAHTLLRKIRDVLDGSGS